jgi:hypothetical protein
VAFRSPYHDEEIVKDWLKDLQDNNIDGSQLVDFRADHCQQAESPTAGGSST